MNIMELVNTSITLTTLSTLSDNMPAIVEECKACYGDILSRLAHIGTLYSGTRNGYGGDCIVCMNACSSHYRFDGVAGSGLLCVTCREYMEDYILVDGDITITAGYDISVEYLDQMHDRVRGCRDHARRAFAYMLAMGELWISKQGQHTIAICACCNKFDHACKRYNWKGPSMHAGPDVQVGEIMYHVRNMCAECRYDVHTSMNTLLSTSTHMIFACRYINQPDVPCGIMADIRKAVLEQVRAVMRDDFTRTMSV